MRQRQTILLTALALCTGLMAQTPQGITAMDEAFATFLSSKEVKTASTRWSHAMKEYHFLYTAPDDGQPIHQKDISLLAQAFAQNAPYATVAYIYNHADNEKPFNTIRYERRDNYFSGIRGYYTIDDGENFRIINIPDGKDHPTSYGMIWHELQFKDRNGKPYRALDGTVYKFYDDIWKMSETNKSNSGGQSSISISNNERVRFETLLEQVNHLAKMYTEKRREGDEKSCDAAVFFLEKLCSGYKGQLTAPQFHELSEAMNAFLKPYDVQRQSIVNNAKSALNKKAEFIPTGKVVTYSYAPDLFGGNDQPRMLYLNYDYGEAKAPQVNVSLKGRGAVNSTALKIKRMSPSLMPYSVEMNDGQFSLSTSFVKDQFLMISDEKGHEMVVIADSIPMEVDLIDGTLRGSRQNERFAECQRRLKALKDECHLYATEDATVVDTAGYHRLMTDVLQLQVQFMKENPDNLIPAWYLSQTFFNMSHEDLSAVLKRNLPYASHLGVQPVWQYAEGLQKRLPGKRFTDAEAVDTTGVSRRLSEYIGHDNYVLLCYWDMGSRDIMKTLKQLRKTYEGKPLTILCVTLNDNLDSWKKYVRKRGLRFEHLMVKPNVSKNSYEDRTKQYEMQILKDYGIAVTLPETILFDPKGRIVATGILGDALKTKLQELNL